MIHLNITNSMSHLNITNSSMHEHIHEPNDLSAVCEFVRHRNITNAMIHMNTTNSLIHQHIHNPMIHLRCVSSCDIETHERYDSYSLIHQYIHEPNDSSAVCEFARHQNITNAMLHMNITNSTITHSMRHLQTQ